jgi:hypothetical protein
MGSSRSFVKLPGHRGMIWWRVSKFTILNLSNATSDAAAGTGTTDNGLCGSSSESSMGNDFLDAKPEKKQERKPA